jgi:hypothetical protein
MAQPHLAWPVPPCADWWDPAGSPPLSHTTRPAIAGSRVRSVSHSYLSISTMDGPGSTALLFLLGLLQISRRIVRCGRVDLPTPTGVLAPTRTYLGAIKSRTVTTLHSYHAPSPSQSREESSRVPPLHPLPTTSARSRATGRKGSQGGEDRVREGFGAQEALAAR